MPYNINTFKEDYELISRKLRSGNTLDAAQFNINAQQATLQKFENDRAIFLKTQETSDFLEIYLKTKIGSPDPLTGYWAYPSDFLHTASMRRYNVIPDQQSNEIPFTPVKNRSWGDINRSQLTPATLQFPKYTEFGDKFKILPKNVGIVYMDYFKQPTQPIWNFTVISDTEVYNPVGSVDFEWDSYSAPEVMANFLQIVGINLKDTELSQFAQMYKQESNSEL